MIEAAWLSGLPKTPAVYALLSGADGRRYVAYVGVAGNLRSRVEQHLVRRDSSVTTGQSAARLEPDLVREVRWWSLPEFEDRAFLEAAELVAAEVLGPVLRSRGATREDSRGLYGDEAHRGRLVDLFGGAPSGLLVLPTLGEALRRLDELERRVAELEDKLRQLLV